MRKGSLTAAVNALAVLQPAISKSLLHFESHLGYALFDRIFREIELLDELALNITERRVGLLRIGVTRPLAILVSSSLVAAPLVRPGLGGALADAFMPCDRNENLVIHRFRPEISMNLAISTNTDKPASRLLSAFRLNLRDAIRQYHAAHDATTQR
ncbi:LysR family transcriptional regulator [Pseudodonghicola xiamenensis]|uniref:HTH lysR-type domain-containing protein n=1 Tax=Pseudodonghicola xiamenensis TaxID=337702 RepID=A0A8J3H7S0_9RHOB|nr:LysR family transcriptional regulator [Pseudodonghicola xiamenensis]GHG96025.1 hypothetical protein GCM10010961_30100 [Pseudodonghicola xiamenensis]